MNQENKLSDGAKKSSIKDWMKKHKFLTGLIAVILIVIIGNAFGGDKNNNKSNNSSEGEKVNVEQKTEKKEKEWISVFKTNASSDKQTESFNLEGGQQKVIYQTTGNQYTLCAVYVMEEGTSIDTDGGFPVVMIDEPKSDETMMRKSSGEYYLDLKVANGSCSVEVQELR